MRALVFAILLGLVAVRPAIADDPIVTLLEAGKGPQKPLRYKVRKGLKKTAVMRMTMGISMDLGSGAPVGQDMPPIEMAFDMKVTDVAANGDIRYDVVFKRPRAIATPGTAKAVIEAMNTALAGFEGMTGYSVVSERGFVKETELEIPDAVPPQARQMMESMKQSFSQMAAPVPEEAVGVGAKWSTKSTMKANGLVIEQTATSTIVSVAGHRATLDVKLVQSAKPQTFTANGITADLRSYAANGGGTSVFDFAALLPAKAKVDLKSKMKIAAGGQEMGMDFTLEMTLSAR